MATLVQAVRMALHVGETRLGVTDIFGEDVGPPLGGVFTATQGLKTAWNSPLDERGIVGTAMGIAYAGGRPVAEIQFCDYGFNTIDLLKVAGNQRWAGNGEFDMPIVLMTPSGSGRMLPLCVQAADQLRQEHGLTFDVLDLRSIFPYDWAAIKQSVLKTGRVLFVNEDSEVTNFGEHLLRRVVDELFYDLLVRPRVLMGKHVPGIGLNQVYERNTVPQYGAILQAMEETATEQA